MQPKRQAKGIPNESWDEVSAADLENSSCKMQPEERAEEEFPKGKNGLRGFLNKSIRTEGRIRV